MTRVLPQAPGALYTEIGEECVLLFPLSAADGQFVTATGPALVEVTGGTPSRQAPVVSGTGPGLIQIAH